MAVFIERTIATVYRDLYEKNTKYCMSLSVGLCFICYSVSGVIEYSRWKIGIDLNYTQSFALVLDVVAILVSEKAKTYTLLFTIFLG